MAKQDLSIPALMRRLNTEADAYLLLEQRRWGERPICPHCGSIDKHYFLRPANGTSRATRTGSMSERRVWKCRDCRKQFTVLVGTIFHGTKISVRTWVMVVLEMCASKNGVSAREIKRKYDLTPKAAWFMLHRIRNAMSGDPLAGLLSGAMQADETWIGDNPRNRHRKNVREAPRASGSTDKQPVFALVHYETREVRARAIPDVTGDTLLAVLQEEADLTQTWLQTDGGKAYRTVAHYVRDHQSVNHEAGQYVGRGGVGTNLV